MRRETDPSDDDAGATRERPRSTVRYDWGPGDSPAERVVEAVAATTGRRPAELGSLYDALDTDALDDLLAGERAAGAPDAAVTVSFRYEGCRVTVRGDGAIFVSPPGADHA